MKRILTLRFLFDRKKLIGAVVLTAAGGIALAGWTVSQTAMHSETPMATLLPQGALLTIEARDFAAVLKQWNDSPQKTAWLKSDNYSVFSNSRLFGRLGGAQGEFSHAAGLPPDLNFLKEVAGTRSVFAWYDIGNLEFLYITHMPSAAAEQTRLLQMRSQFATRQVGSQTFYVRTQADPDQGGQPRTVAFATTGDWLLLATREDLIAGALALIASPGNAADSLASEPWFADSQTAGDSSSGKDFGQLRMTLNLEKIVPSPYFRSYWIQRNVSELKQFRSAVVDLHMESDGFREERVLLPKSLPAEADTGTFPDLNALVNFLPKRPGVYRAQAMPTAEAALASLNEKLLQRGTSAYSDSRFAPAADLKVQQAGGSGADSFETRIDAAPMARPVHDSEQIALRQALESSGLNAMLVMSRTGAATAGLWVPFQSALVLVSSKDWDGHAMQLALQQVLQASITTSNLGLGWNQVHSAAGDYFEINQARRLELAIRGKYCIFSDTPELMQEMLARADSNSKSAAAISEHESSRPSLIAGFEPADERASFARWTKLVDHNLSGGQSNQATVNAGGGTDVEPAFFSQNVRSLGEVFAALESERIVERRSGAVTLQAVTYTWRQ